MQTIAQLNQMFGIPDTIHFEAGSGGLTRAVITHATAEAHVYLYGAHVTHFQLRGQPAVLFLSRKAFFEVGKPIRGGVPVCFPWFGNKEDDPEAGLHGTVRLREWEVVAATPMTLTLRTTEATWELQYTVMIGMALTMALEVRNTGTQPSQFEEALHTYFAVSDVRQIAIEGLAGAEYLDKNAGLRRKTEDAVLLRLTQEPDRLYLNTRATCVIHDPGWRRRIIVEKENSDSTVVWNPWDKRAAALPDFSADEWPGMVCVETVNARENAVLLSAGQTHTMSATIRVAPL